ncbi:MAG TPA: YidB family protein [Bacteroidota bacterium]|nr:YidB family protein [Bacteroidota bacterium]
MGLLGDLLGTLGRGSGAGNSAETQVMSAIAGMLSDKQSGGLAGLVQNFQKNGLGDVVSSWIGTGKNLPISADQIQKVFGNQQVSQLAQRVGIEPEKVTTTLANVLPGLVDKLTPNGKLPNEEMLQQGLNLLKGKLGI